MKIFRTISCGRAIFHFTFFVRLSLTRKGLVMVVQKYISQLTFMCLAIVTLWPLQATLRKWKRRSLILLLKRQKGREI